MPNYKEITELMAEFKPFKHGYSMHAKWLGDKYFVVSYRTVIGVYDRTACEWRINNRKYSPTTSRQQTYLRRAIAASGLPFVDMDEQIRL